MVRATQPDAVTRRRLTVDEFRRMGDVGILQEDDHVELIDGELVQKAAMNEPHVSCVMRLNYWFVPRLVGRAIVSPQSSIRLSNYSEPEPDIVLVQYRDDFYASALPTPDDILLIVELADSSLRYDRTVKLPLYAAAGVIEVWIVDLRAHRVTAYRDPTPAGYQQVVSHTRRSLISPVAFPDLQLRWEDVFGRA